MEAVDAGHDTVDFMLSEKRDEAAATLFFKQAINNNGFPKKVVMDKSGANFVGLVLNSSRGRRKLYRLWLKQDRLCPYCQKPIKRSTPWETRYRVKRADGGTNASSNLVMCHLYCQEPHFNAENSGETGCRKVPS